MLIKSSCHIITQLPKVIYMVICTCPLLFKNQCAAVEILFTAAQKIVKQCTQYIGHMKYICMQKKFYDQVLINHVRLEQYQYRKRRRKKKIYVHIDWVSDHDLDSLTISETAKIILRSYRRRRNRVLGLTSKHLLDLSSWKNWRVPATCIVIPFYVNPSKNWHSFQFWMSRSTPGLKQKWWQGQWTTRYTT